MRQKRILEYQTPGRYTRRKRKLKREDSEGLGSVMVVLGGLTFVVGLVGTCDATSKPNDILTFTLLTTFGGIGFCLGLLPFYFTLKWNREWPWFQMRVR